MATRHGTGGNTGVSMLAGNMIQLPEKQKRTYPRSDGVASHHENGADGSVL